MNLSGELDFNTIRKVEFPIEQYVRQACDKKQIVLHHTGSGMGADGDVQWWKKTKERIATCLIIGRDGRIIQCFHSSYWAYHLGVSYSTLVKFNSPKTPKQLNMESVGIELDSWGGLTWNKSKGEWVSWTGKVIPSENVVEYPKCFRGYRAYEKYTDEQLTQLWRVLKYFQGVYEMVNYAYRPEMFRFSIDALMGFSGIWGHTSFRMDSEKQDPHPQSKLIEVLKSL